MTTIKVKADNVEKVCVSAASGCYDVLIGNGITENITDMIRISSDGEKVLVITDTNTSRLFFGPLSYELVKNGYEVFEYVMTPGEGSKSLSVYGQILEYAAEKQLTRSDLVISLGGGVVGDVSGFAAGTYLRGIDYYQIPTTLLAAVDSSVGGKTGINLRSGKNLAGIFNQPKGVLCDTNNIKSLSHDVLGDGISEMIKYGMICDKELFERIIKEKFTEDLNDNIKRCVEIKARIVSRDELDKGERQLLNFGHTAGHGVEKLSGYEISHGHAVAMGMSLITRAAVSKGVCDMAVADALISKLKSFDLPTESPFSSDEIWNTALSDKKRAGSNITIVVPEDIGACRLYTLTIDDFRDFLKGGMEK